MVDLLIYSNASPGPECVTEAFCNHGDRSAPLWSLHRNERQKMKRGEEKDAHEHSFLPPGERTHFPRDVGVSALPRWADKRSQGWRTSTHTHTPSRRGRGTDLSQLYFCEGRLTGAHTVPQHTLLWRAMDA